MTTVSTETPAALARPAMRTPLYLILAALGALIVVAAFLPWASVDRFAGPDGSGADAELAEAEFGSLPKGEAVAGPESGSALTVSGVDSGGWGPAAIIAGLAIAVIALIGYTWNPFSDPEAMFVAAFAATTLIAALVKMFDTSSLIDPVGDWYPESSAGIGLWLVALAAGLALVGAVWIVISRPAAEARLA